MARCSNVIAGERRRPRLASRSSGNLLTVASDLLLDEARARSTYNMLRGVLPLVPEQSDLRRRAELVYETVFGSQIRALDVVQEILNEYPEPTLSNLASGLATMSAMRCRGSGILAWPGPFFLITIDSCSHITCLAKLSTLFSCWPTTPSVSET